MLRTLTQSRERGLAYRLAGIAVFTLLTVVAARVRVELGPVPFTLQTLAVILSGLVLGARDGAMSQIAYVALVAAGLPLDTRGLGTAVFLGPTWGYLVGFIPAAYVSGWLVERLNTRLIGRLAAALVGMLVVFALGVIVLKLNQGMTWPVAVTEGFVRFIPEAVGKALIAAALAEGGRALLLRGQ